MLRTRADWAGGDSCGVHHPSLPYWYWFQKKHDCAWVLVVEPETLDTEVDEVLESLHSNNSSKSRPGNYTPPEIIKIVASRLQVLT